MGVLNLKRPQGEFDKKEIIVELLIVKLAITNSIKCMCLFVFFFLIAERIKDIKHTRHL